MAAIYDQALAAKGAMLHDHGGYGQEIYAEAGKMVYKTANVKWETRMSGGSIGDKIMGALRRTVMGESVFLTYFRSNGVPGWGCRTQ